MVRSSPLAFRSWLCLGLLLFVALTGSPVEIVRSLSRGLHATGLLRGHSQETLWETTAMRRVYGPWFLKYLVGALLISLLWRWIRRYAVRLLITAFGAVLTAVYFVRALPHGGPVSFSTTPAGGGFAWRR